MILGFLRVPRARNVPKVPQGSSPSKCLKVSQSVAKCLKVSQSVSKCLKVFQSVSKCLKVSQSVSKCLKVFQTVSKCHRVPQGVSKCLKVFQKCFKRQNTLITPPGRKVAILCTSVRANSALSYWSLALRAEAPLDHLLQQVCRDYTGLANDGYCNS